MSKKSFVPKLRITERGGGAALWIGEKNIRDISPKNVTPDVLDAIRRAYEMGRMSAITELCEAAHELNRGSVCGYDKDSGWVDERKQNAKH